MPDESLDVGRIVSEMSPQLPAAAWEGWFFIAVPRAGSQVRWAKTHLYRRKPGRFLRALGEFGGLTAEAELLTLVATGEEVLAFRRTLKPEALSGASTGFALTIDEELQWSGDGRRFIIERSSGDLELRWVARARDRLGWIRNRLRLNCVGLHSDLSGFISAGPVAAKLEGLAIQEHAWGGRVPFPPRWLVTGRWHRDVLSFDRIGESQAPGHTALAALWMEIPFSGGRGVRLMGRVPGEEFARFESFDLEVLKDGRLPGGQAPLQWRGRLSGERGVLEYEASADTPVAPEAPGGGFRGFAFEGSWSPKGGLTVAVGGRGFCEFGGPP